MIMKSYTTDIFLILITILIGINLIIALQNSNRPINKQSVKIDQNKQEYQKTFDYAGSFGV